MPFRFRRTVSLGKFFRVNVGKKSVSTRIGPKGFGFTSGTAGKRITTGLPGTGLSFTKKLHPRRPPEEEPREEKPTLGRLPFHIRLLLAAIIIGALWLIGRYM